MTDSSPPNIPDSSTPHDPPAIQVPDPSQEHLSPEELRRKHKRDALAALTSSKPPSNSGSQPPPENTPATNQHQGPKNEPPSPQENIHYSPPQFGSTDSNQKRQSVYNDSIIPNRALTGPELALITNIPDDVIPNAVVIKNINFAIQRNTLLSTIANLGLPLPYAFNYHYESGMFRGLAFANFRTNEEAARIIVGLNGITLLGRALKVEYKKTLSATAEAAPTKKKGSNDRKRESFLNTETTNQPSTIKNLESLLTSDPASIDAFRSRRATLSIERPRSLFMNPNPLNTYSNYPPTSSKNVDVTPQSPISTMFDLNDKDTRLLYDLISQFRRDKNVVELDFPSALNSVQRQTVMLIAEHFGLNHETKGELSNRRIRLYKSLETLLEATEIKSRATNYSNTDSSSYKYSQPLSSVFSEPLNTGFGGFSGSRNNRNSMQQYNTSRGSINNYNIPKQNTLGRSRGLTTTLNNRNSMYSFPGISPVESNGNGNSINDTTQNKPTQNNLLASSGSNSSTGSRNDNSYSNRVSKLTANKQRNRMSAAPQFPPPPIPQHERKSPQQPIIMPSRTTSSESTVNDDPAAVRLQRQMQLKVLEQKRVRRMSEATYNNFQVPKLEKPANKAIPIVAPSGETVVAPGETVNPTPKTNE
ncbi:hypothetical protein BB559_003376 [Furculomyces boomerangus]|uniref:RRM domain-containing protein n=2 Tax=Harpellales TaxID=61421 RepID=A0A2T9YLP8_9FUNG|nr:hypothetical protein BB559_003376 [Furculomyces boomerangus]PWA00435.1 hypothetical protein BB558_003531 [Smittium angustum]